MTARPDRPTAAPARFPYVEHRTLAEVDRNEAYEARARPTFRDQLVGVLRLDASF